MVLEPMSAQKNPPDREPQEMKPLTLEEKWKLLIDVVLRDAIGEAETKLPQEGFFPKIKIGLVYPDDEEIYGLLNLEPGTEKAGRVAHVGAYRHGTYRLVSNFFFFDSTQDLMDWLQAEDTGSKLIEVFHNLLERVD